MCLLKCVTPMAESSHLQPTNKCLQIAHHPHQGNFVPTPVGSKPVKIHP